ncbi:meiosis 1 arrest protein isoform X4 [Mustela putorius furo]|uniref:Meiosis 1 arrest protein isoform X4 n=1 Tax=Mustela putorius furo TaxID=9669 RepID=A0A8U0S467_MUSPF|nr:meiosis 1 arrest protein isoform X4 [Mustela putorius furo]
MYHGRSTGKGPTTPMQMYQQPPRLLIVQIALPSWADTCSNLCEALQNFFSLACSLMGPSRMSLFSLYVVQNQHECILPFVITVLTSQPGKKVVKQLEEGLKDTDLVRVRRLQVVEITKGDLEYMDSVSPAEEPSSDESSILGTDIDLQTIDNDVVSMEIFFKAWLHNSGTDQEHIHLLLPSRCFSNISKSRDDSMCLKCDLQERLLSPSLLPGTADGSLRMDDPKGDFSTLYQMASQSSASPYKLRVIKALNSSGICESLIYGLPFILRPTSCWQLDWDELETNQQHFHALCHSLLKREWLLLAKGEPLSRGHSLRQPASTFYVIVPSRSPTLLVKAVATRELMLPSPFPLLPEDPPDDSLKIVESLLDSLELEPSYNPLQAWSHLYSHLSSTFIKPQGRLHPSWESQALRKVRLPPYYPSSPQCPESQRVLLPCPQFPTPCNQGNSPPPWIFPGGRENQANPRRRKKPALYPRQRKLEPLPDRDPFLPGTGCLHMVMFRYLNCSTYDNSLGI